MSDNGEVSCLVVGGTNLVQEVGHAYALHEDGILFPLASCA